MTTAVMLDIETMGFRTTSTILTFGAVKFNPYDISQEVGAAENTTMYVRLDVDEQLNLGRTTDESTMQWWAEQSEDVQAEAFSDEDRVSLATFTSELNRFLVGVDEVWAQGPTFDMVIIESLYRDLGLPVPWSYNRVMDSRTLFRLHGDPRPKNGPGAHNALVDAYNQAVAVQQAIDQAGIKRP